MSVLFHCSVRVNSSSSLCHSYPHIGFSAGRLVTTYLHCHAIYHYPHPLLYRRYLRWGGECKVFDAELVDELLLTVDGDTDGTTWVSVFSLKNSIIRSQFKMLDGRADNFLQGDKMNHRFIQESFKASCPVLPSYNIQKHKPATTTPSPRFFSWIAMLAKCDKNGEIT